MRMTTLFHHMTLFVRLNTVRDSKPNNNSPELFVSVVITDNDLWLSGRPWLVRFRISSRCNSIESTNVSNVTTISRDGKGKLLFEKIPSREYLTVANRIDLRLVLHLVVSNHAWIHKYSTWIPVRAAPVDGVRKNNNPKSCPCWRATCKLNWRSIKIRQKYTSAHSARPLQCVKHTHAHPGYNVHLNNWRNNQESLYWMVKKT